MNRFNQLLDLIYGAPDVWTMLRDTDKPVVLYGTGDGADKILDEFDRRGIRAAGVFASDGFVRSRTFRGMKVLSLADAEAMYPDFVAVIAFASSLPEVMGRMFALSERHATVAPDVPVYGEGISDREWFIANADRLNEVRAMLEDDESRRVFDSVLAYRYSGDIEWLKNALSDKGEVNMLLGLSGCRHYCDLGAYNGDTVAEMLAISPDTDVFAMEPDPRSFRKLNEFCSSRCPNAELYNSAAWDSECTLEFGATGGRGASGMRSAKQKPVNAVRLDYILYGRMTDYIKYDVEGSEKHALLGSARTVEVYRPKLCVSLYHRTNDIFELPVLVKRLYGGYKLYMRRFPYVPAWDLNLYAV